MIELLRCNLRQLIIKLAYWLSHTTIFGPHDKIVQNPTEAWCIAKIRRLVGPIEPHVDSKFEEEFELAEYLKTSTFKHQNDSSERQFIFRWCLTPRAREFIQSKGGPRPLGFHQFLACLGPYEETNSRVGATTSLSLPIN